FSENFYQLELPLQFTPLGASSATEIWPEVNELNVLLSDLNKVKSLGIAQGSLNTVNYYEMVDGQPVPVGEFAPRIPGTLRIGIRRNPFVGSIRGMMVGM